jgi:hypothetical protein
MKTKKIFISLIAIFIFSLTACKKDTISDPVPTPNATLSTDSNYISKFYSIEKYGNMIDTALTSYTYDNLKRVSKIIFISKSNGIVDNKDSTIYTYFGNDTLPIKMNYFFQNNSFFAEKDTSTSFLSYNNSNQIIKDSTIYSSKTLTNGNYIVRKNISNYSYSLNKNYRQFSSTIIVQSQSGIGQPEIQTDTATIDANKNVTNVRSKNISGNIFPNINITTRITTFTYDNKPSPFSLQNVSNIFPYFPIGQNILYPLPGSKNNRLKGQDTFIDSSGSSTYDDDFTGKYTYKANGYPFLILIQDTNIPTNYIKYVFEYTTL